MKWLTKFFKKLWNVIRKIIAIVLIIIAVIFAVMACISTGGASLVFALYAIAALTGAFLVDKKTTTEVTGKIGEALGSVAETVGSVGGQVVGGVASGVLGAVLDNPVLLAVGCGVLAWWLFSDSKAPQAPATTNNEVTRNRSREERDPDYVVGSITDAWSPSTNIATA